MGLLNITGTVTAHGQSQFDNFLTIYAHFGDGERRFHSMVSARFV